MLSVFSELSSCHTRRFEWSPEHAREAYLGALDRPNASKQGVDFRVPAYQDHRSSDKRPRESSDFCSIPRPTPSIPPQPIALFAFFVRNVSQITMQQLFPTSAFVFPQRTKNCEACKYDLSKSYMVHTKMGRAHVSPTMNANTARDQHNSHNAARFCLLSRHSGGNCLMKEKACRFLVPRHIITSPLPYFTNVSRLFQVRIFSTLIQNVLDVRDHNA